jgi:hypothetical protein
MYDNINEKIDVIALFGRNHRDARPFRLKWKGREYDVRTVDYVYRQKSGEKLMYYFCVTDGANFFELKFDANDLGWTVNRVWNDDPH